VWFVKKHRDPEATVLTTAELLLGPLTERLDYCGPHSRCGSGPCPECDRAFQRFFVSECSNLLEGDFASCQQTAVLSLICETWNRLDGASLDILQRNAKRLLRDAGVRHALGGIDISRNEDRDSKDAYWCLHVWAIIPSNEVEEWGPKLRRLYVRTDRVRRPIMVKPYDGNVEALAYALKTEFKRRVSYVQEKLVDGVKRTCSNTSNQSLRVAERLELYPFLDSQGLAARVFLMGVRPTRTDQGISLVKLNSKPRNSESDEGPS
jgi:hypothetical protein